MIVSINVVIDKRRVLNNGEYPVKLRLTSDGISNYIRTKYSLSSIDFDKITSGKRLNPGESRLNIEFSKMREKADRIVSEMDVYDFAQFKSLFFDKKKTEDFILIFKEFIKSTPDEKLSLKRQAIASLSQFENFIGKDTFNTSDLTEHFISSFISHLSTIGLGNSTKPRPLKSNSIKNYINIIKTIVLQLIKEKRFNRDKYPFITEHLQLPNDLDDRTVLDLDEIALLFGFIPNKYESFPLDMFKFSYLSSGMNMSDIFRLKWGKISEERFTFIRQKTKRSNKTVVVFLNSQLTDIINRHGINKGNPDDYVFDVLQNGISFKEEKILIGVAIKKINLKLVRIAAKLKINKHVTTYAARHSYATIMMGNEVPLAFISKQLGHASLVSTQKYLGAFPDHRALEYSDLLIPKSKETE